MIPKPIYIRKNNQTLLHFFAKDFSFFNEEQISKVMRSLTEHSITINLLQRGAIQCSFVVNNHNREIDTVIDALQNDFLIDKEEHLILETVRHGKGNESALVSSKKDIILEQRSKTTYQVVTKQ